jgi:enoyl-CoA hydratase/carnithine racemase
MTFEMYEALHDACAELDADPRTRVLVLKGAGDRAFASGTDIRQFVDFQDRPGRAQLRGAPDAACCRSWRA